MSKLAMSFHSACVCLAVLTLGVFGQVVTTEPAKPKWGDTLKITYDPRVPGAAFTLDQGQAEAKRSFPGFSVTSLDGKKYDLATLRGKIVVLNFWFIACGPCKAEMPSLNKLVKDYEGKGVTFLAMTFDDAESLKAFLKESAFSYEIIPDSQELIDKLEITVFPEHYVINQRGEVELTLRGGGEGNVAQMRNVIARLVAANKETK
jgi:thiol-disulfide isomerase/thioredoxin